MALRGHERPVQSAPACVPGCLGERLSANSLVMQDVSVHTDLLLDEVQGDLPRFPRTPSTHLPSSAALSTAPEVACTMAARAPPRAEEEPWGASVNPASSAAQLGACGASILWFLS